MQSRFAASVSGLVILAILGLPGCVDQNNSTTPEAPGSSLAERRECNGQFRDGTPVHCQQGAVPASPAESIPPGWIATSGPFGAPETTFYRTVNPNDPVGGFRLAVSYDVKRGVIQENVSLDPIHGLAWLETWPQLVFWESGLSGFVEFPFPVEQEGGSLRLWLLHPHTVAQRSPWFNVSIDTPALHDKTVRPLWGLYGDEVRVVHKVLGDGGPYFFHGGQNQTIQAGFSLAQAGVDYSVLSRVIMLQALSTGTAR